MTAKAVADGKMTNEFLGAFTRRTDEIKRRLREGTLSEVHVMRDLQRIIESTPNMAPKPWAKSVPMGGESAQSYFERLSEAGYLITDQDKEKLLVIEPHPILVSTRAADFWWFRPEDLGLDAPFSYRLFLDRAREVVSYSTGPGFIPPTIETAIMLALGIANMEDSPIRKFYDQILVGTEPFRFRGQYYLLGIFGDSTKKGVYFKKVKEIEDKLNQRSLSDRFAFMGE